MKKVLINLNDSSRRMLLQNTSSGPSWVNDKQGPDVSLKLFNELLDNEYIFALNRVTNSYDGPWYGITQKGRDAIKELVSFDIKH